MSHHSHRLAVLFCVLLLSSVLVVVAGGSVAATVQVVDLEIVSLTSEGVAANRDSHPSSVSADGTRIAFASYADNLVPGDTNDAPDVFVHDRTTGVTTRVSVASDGTEGNGGSNDPMVGAGGPAISADGSAVAFWSYADNLVPDDTNGWQDVFVHNLVTGSTTRVSISSDGVEGDGGSEQPSISGDGTLVAFSSYAGNLVPDDTSGWLEDVFVHDVTTGVTTRVSVGPGGEEANGGSRTPALSADGSVVAFDSGATNLVPGDDLNDSRADVYVAELATGDITRVSIASDGTQASLDCSGQSISEDGSVIAFHSYADNLVPNDTNGIVDLFVHDRTSGATSRVSVASDGTESNGGSYDASVSADGLHVAFFSGASNLVSDDTNDLTDVFVHDRTTGTTTRISVAPDGTEANDDAYTPSISTDGSVVTFHSGADNLVPGDTNGYWDVFVSQLGSTSAPVLAPIGDLSVEEESALDVSITASDADNDPLEFSLGGEPEFVTLVDHGDGSATLAIAPAVGDAGFHPGVTVTVSDGTATDSETFTITVTEAVGDPTERLVALKAALRDYVDEGAVTRVFARRVVRLLNKALLYVERDSTERACAALTVFATEVAAAEVRGAVAPEAADYLITEANAIRTSLGCVTT